jgi:nicotinamidase-related amidase
VSNRALLVMDVQRGIVENQSATEIHPEIAPQDGDIVVTKRRVSALTIDAWIGQQG